MAGLTLKDIPAIAVNVHKMKTKSVKLLHEFLFNVDDGRKNRNNIRKFAVFKFEEKSCEYNEKFKQIQDGFTDRDLVIICCALGLEYGEDTKNELIKKLMRYLIDLNLLKEENKDDDNDDEDKDDDKNSGGSELNKDEDDRSSLGEQEDLNGLYYRDNTGYEEKASVCRDKFENCHISYKDIEDTLRSFDGEGDYGIEKYISDFEELANLLKWNELQKYIFAKKSLNGVARFYVMSEKNLSSWYKIKSALLEEFGQKVSNADVHKTMMKRKMQRDESVHEYYLIMKEIASRRFIDDNSLMQYIVEGIKNSPVNKIMLYGAKTMKEFKEKLHHYHAYRSENHNSLKEKQIR